MVVEEDGQILIAFRPETIQFISDTLKIKDGDVVVIDDASDADNDSPIIIINKLQ